MSYNIAVFSASQGDTFTVSSGTTSVTYTLHPELPNYTYYSPNGQTIIATNSFSNKKNLTNFTILL
jgi:hypothetical protein